MITPWTPDDLQQYMDAQQITARLIRDVGETPTVPAAAIALGVEADQIVKTLLFLIEPSAQPNEPVKPPTPVVVISHGERRVDKKLLAERFGVGNKKVKFAPAEVVVELLGYPAGGVPPFGHRTRLPVILDASVINAAERFDGTVYGGGGDHATMMAVSVAELLRVLQPEVLVVS